MANRSTRTLDIPLGIGLNTKADRRALPPPALTTAENVVFDELGGLQKRKPFTALALDIEGGGTLSGIKRLAVYEDELLAFTDTQIYSWAPELSQWVLRDTHLAVTVEENQRFPNNYDQLSGDHAEAGGISFYIWHQDGTTVYAAAIDTTSGAVVYGPTAWSGNGAGSARVRCVSLGTRILAILSHPLNGDIYGVNIDPADIAGTITGTFAINSASDASGSFDVDVADGEAFVVWRRTTSTAYGMARVESDDTVTRQTVSNTHDNFIVVAARGSSPNQKVAVVRQVGTNVRGDLFDGLTTDTHDVLMGTAVASASQATCAWRSTAESGGEFRCYAFWSGVEATDQTAFVVTSNYVDDAAAAGTASTFVRQLGLVSHAFSQGGRVFVWCAFAGASGSTGAGTAVSYEAQLQNVYMLFRDDGRLVAKSVNGDAGGFAHFSNHLPTVQNTSGNVWKWVGVQRRFIQLADQEDGLPSRGYGEKTVTEIRFEFDSDDARIVRQFGKTLYISGGMLSQYDGEGVAEVGFMFAPWMMAVSIVTSGGPTIPAGATHSFRMTYGWPNAKGELDRSSSAVVVQNSTTVVSKWGLTAYPLWATLKQSAEGRAECSIEVWRTLTDPIPQSRAYLVTSQDRSTGGSENGWLENDPTAGTVTVNDDFTDEELEVNETNEETRGRLANDSPPPASIVHVSDERIYLAGIAGYPHRICYSQTRVPGEVAKFSRILCVDLPEIGGKITGIADLFGTIVVFKEDAVFSLTGDGLSNTGAGSNFRVRLVPSDVGANSAREMVTTGDGIVFNSARGLHLLDRGFGITYIGAPVADYESEAVVSMHTLESQHEVRVMTTSRCLVYHTIARAWSTWTLASAVDAAIWRGTYVYATDSGVLTEDADFTNPTNYSCIIETAWINLAGIYGYGKSRRFGVTGEYRSDHRMKIEVGRDGDETYFQTKNWNPSPSTAGDPINLRHRIAKKRCTSVRFRITDLAANGSDPATGESFKLSGLALEYELRQGMARRFGAAQKQ